MRGENRAATRCGNQCGIAPRAASFRTAGKEDRERMMGRVLAVLMALGLGSNVNAQN